MADKIIENNQVSIMGKIDTGFTFSHQVFGEGFYTMELLVRRLSDSEDRIPVMVSERLLDITQDYTGQYIEIHGQFRSYNRHEEKHNRLVLSVFAREVNFVEEQDESLPVNQIDLSKQLVHNKGNSCHVSTVLQQGEKEKQGYDYRKETQYTSYSIKYPIHNQ